MAEDQSYSTHAPGDNSEAGQTVPPDPYVGTLDEPQSNASTLIAPPREDVDSLNNYIDGSTIEGREGNFVFTVGNVSSGKSTLQSFLIHRLWTDSRIVFEHAPVDDSQDSEAYLHGWVRNVANGLFPVRTTAGKIREFRIRFGQASRPRLTLNFIEIAGEDINSIVPSVAATTRELNPYLERYLREPNINKRFVFVSDASANTEKSVVTQQKLQEDLLFSTLINHLVSPDGVALKRLSILFVVTKWDRAKGDYKSVKQYFRDHFPQTLALTTRSGRINANFMPFSVGEVREGRSADDNAVVPLIVRKETRYIDFMISWLYESFVGDHLTGYPSLRPSALQRFKNWVARII